MGSRGERGGPTLCYGDEIGVAIPSQRLAIADRSCRQSLIGNYETYGKPVL